MSVPLLLGFVVLLLALPGAWCQNLDGNQAFAHAVELHRAGDFQAAARAYEAVLAADPTRFDARSNLGAVLVKLGRYQEAVEQYRTALQSAPPGAETPVRLNLGIAYYKASQIAQAAVELSKVHSNQPDNLNATLLLADCQLQLGEFRKVIELLTPLELSQSDNRALAYLLGMALIRDGQTGLGQKLVDRILRDGESAEGHFLMGSGMLFAHDYPDAVREFARAIALNPNLPSLQSYYGQALLETGDADGAEKAFRKELEANPNDYEANQHLGEILVHRERQDEAKPFLTHAALLRPGPQVISSQVAPDTGGLKVGTPAPDFPAISLRRHLQRGPVVLIFGSYTCPRFRGDAASLNALEAKYRARVSFELVYVREAHAGSQWQSTINERAGVGLPEARTLHEKKEHAAVCVRKLAIPYSTVVDAMDRTIEAAYDGWPSRVYLIGRDGRVAFNSPLGELDFRSADLDRAIASALEKR